MAFCAQLFRELGAGDALNLDLATFWGGAKLAAEGRAVDAFDVELLSKAHGVRFEPGEMPLWWMYPPTLQLAVTPIALLSFSAAFAVFSALSLAAWIFAVSRIMPLRDGLSGWVVASPPVLVALKTGNISLLWASGFVVALGCLRDRQVGLSGVLLGLLTVKPQLGLLVPVALFAAKEWRVIAWAGATAALLVSASLAVFGPLPWFGFFNALTESWERTETLEIGKAMISPKSFFLAVGLDPAVATLLHVATALAAAASVWVVWRRRVPFGLKAATLLFGALLATPHAFEYELAMAIAAILFLIREAGPRPALLGWGLLLWCLAIPTMLWQVDVAWSGTPALLVSLALTVWLSSGDCRCGTSIRDRSGLY